MYDLDGVQGKVHLIGFTTCPMICLENYWLRVDIRNIERCNVAIQKRTPFFFRNIFVFPIGITGNSPQLCWFGIYGLAIATEGSGFFFWSGNLWDFVLKIIEGIDGGNNKKKQNQWASWLVFVTFFWWTLECNFQTMGPILIQQKQLKDARNEME